MKNCPVCGKKVRYYEETGNLNRHKAESLDQRKEKFGSNNPYPWCPGGGVQRRGPVGETPEVTYKLGDIDSMSEAIALKTNLSEHVCRELLLNGWTFVQELDKPNRWEQPSF